MVKNFGSEISSLRELLEKSKEQNENLKSELKEAQLEVAQVTQVAAKESEKCESNCNLSKITSSNYDSEQEQQSIATNTVNKSHDNDDVSSLVAELKQLRNVISLDLQ